MEIFGTLDNFFETGTEGVHWAIDKAPSGYSKGASYDDLFLLEEGDHLEIYDPETLYVKGEHKILWSGVIKKDNESCLCTRHTNPEVKQQLVNGYWVHWLQQGFEDYEQWCWFFVMHYPARLVRNK